MAYLDFEVAFLVRLAERGEGLLAAENVLEQVLAAEVAVYDGVGKQLGDVALGIAVRPCSRFGSVQVGIQQEFQSELGLRDALKSLQRRAYRRCRWASS